MYLRQPFLYLFLLSVLSIAQAQESRLTSETLSGLHLRSIGPASMSGRIVDLAVVEKDPYTFYVASATGGVWKTTNNGVTLKPVFEKEGTHSVGDIAVHQGNPDFVWVGTGERANRQSSSWGDGVYRSTDGGKTWTNMGLKDSHHIGRIVLHPTDTHTVYVAAMGHLWGPNKERGLYKSTNGGEAWERLLYIDENTGVVDIAMDPSDPDILYTATYQRRRRPYGFHGGGPGSGLYRSTDGGKTWNELTEGLPEGDKGRIGISIYRKDPNIVYVSVEQGYQYNASTAYNKRKAGVYRSEDKGLTWTFMSDWNPRPMYASQILVDPNNDQRVYMMNSFSYSDNGGKKFIVPRQSLHSDDRILWVNPKDSRHLIKGDDGGLGISYDQAKTWLYHTALPVSQFYRVNVDMKKPYHVYGGLQDNGSWMGPSETYRNEGILNSDWIKTGGGDGFLNLVHHENENELYGESQYLGLFKLDLKTRQRRSIRPGDPKGRIGPRRNWDAWGPGTPEPELGNAMAPGNWDGPFFLSPHDPNTIYAGTNIFWKSTDGGSTWTALGNLTTKVNRGEMLIMGQRADTSTASLDDGIPYYPTLTAIAGSPLQKGVLYAGTDDGQLQVSLNDGKDWKNVSEQLPGLPESAWVSGIEVSKFYKGTAYVAINNYRNNDFSNYLYKTTDQGNTWTSITGNLPAARVVRTIREDTRNPKLLYLGTEIGLFISIDGGLQWVALKNNMPTLPFNDLVIHPRDNDLVLGTHGRGIWILDNLNALQELTAEVLEQEANLFSIPTAEMIRYSREGGHTGDMIFRGKNPPAGAIIDYYLKTPVEKKEISLTIHSPEGELIRTIKADTTPGIHRTTWDLAYPRVSANSTGRRSFGLSGLPATPGVYKVRLSVKDQIYEQYFQVKTDPRLEISIDDYKVWIKNLTAIAALYKAIDQEAKAIRSVSRQVEKLVKEKKKLNPDARQEVEKVNGLYRELLNRTRTLYSQVLGWTGPLTTDQQSQMDYYQDMLNRLALRKKDFIKRTVPKLNQGLKGDERIKTTG